MFELLALMGSTAHFGVQAKALLVDTLLLRGLHLLAGDGLQAQASGPFSIRIFRLIFELYWGCSVSAGASQKWKSKM
jgi:hypothetical protein